MKSLGSSFGWAASRIYPNRSSRRITLSRTADRSRCCTFHDESSPQAQPRRSRSRHAATRVPRATTTWTREALCRHAGPTSAARKNDSCASFVIGLRRSGHDDAWCAGHRERICGISPGRDGCCGLLIRGRIGPVAGFPAAAPALTRRATGNGDLMEPYRRNFRSSGFTAPGHATRRQPHPRPHLGKRRTRPRPTAPSIARAKRRKVTRLRRVADLR
jgi:hypothetical protein